MFYFSAAFLDTLGLLHKCNNNVLDLDAGKCVNLSLFSTITDYEIFFSLQIAEPYRSA